MLAAPFMIRVLAPLVVVSTLASACGAANAAPTDTAAGLHALTEPASAASAPATTTTAAPTTTTTTRPPTTTLPDPHRTLVARARNHISHLIAYDSPDGPPVALPFPVPNPHQFGGPLTLMVTKGNADDEWLEVQLPVRPNGSVGWIPAKDYIISSTRVRAEVNLSNTSVQVFDGDELIADSQAAIGNWRTPTPVGTFYVAAKRINPPEEAYLGTWAIVLSSYSEVLETFSGGLPVIAIHGSNNPDQVLGRAISNGCVRVPNDVIEFLAEHVPLGAPVHISA